MIYISLQPPIETNKLKPNKPIIMKKFTLVLSLMLAALFSTYAQQFNYTDSWGKAGFNLVTSESSAIEVIYSVPNFTIEDQAINGDIMKNIMLPGNFLFNDAGAPNLPATGRYVAIPQGSTPSIRIVSQQIEVIQNVDMAPAPVIPMDNDDNPLQYTKNMTIYNQDAFYPASPVIISEVTQIRGTDAVILSITPFQYNPATKELIVYRDLQIAIDCEGGSGVYGDDRLRSKYWDGIMSDMVLNYNALPEIDYASRMNEYLQNSPESDECEYIIITPTGADFISWADSIAKFRNEQGILTKVFTVDEVGGNSTVAIEGFINNAYNTWNPAPVACLLLGDYGTNASNSVISPIYNNYCASDNIYADVNNDMMPDVIFARMTANNNTQLTTFITKFLDYERNPVTDPDFYNHPITALGWQTERWFQLCSEIIGGYFKHARGRDPVRINAIYQGNPGSIWSTAINTNSIINYFGPNGLGYIPAQPSELGGWSGGNSSMVNNAINAGAFIIQHRDHGNTTVWGEPAYNNNNINQLTNDKLIHVFSINCLTGKYNWGGECMTEKFHRHTKNGDNAGALSVTGASETSYSFVNDTYVWGMADNMWPDFMPDETSEVEHRGIMPAFGNAGGKYFLKQSNWPYNTSNKAVTYNLFHHHGDAFSCLYDTVPENLDVNHETTIAYGSPFFTVSANENSTIALSVDSELLAAVTGSGSSNPVSILIPTLDAGTVLKVVVTLTNCFRYEAFIPVIEDLLVANFSSTLTELCTENKLDFTDESTGTPTAWEWTFEGGTPETSTEQNPTDITYDVAGTYAVSLTVTRDGETSTETKSDFIQVLSTPTADFSEGTLCENTPVELTDMSNPNGGTITSWLWTFGDPSAGASDTSILQNPVHTYTTAGPYSITLIVTNNDMCANSHTKEINIVGNPETPTTPEGPDEVDLKDGLTTEFTVVPVVGTTGYDWMLTPESAGIIEPTSPDGSVSLVTWEPDFKGDAEIKTGGIAGDCIGLFSPVKVVNVKNTLGISEMNAYDITVYPNPTNGKFSLILNAGDQTKINIRIYNVLGSIVYSESNVNVFNKLTKTLDLSSMPAGIYHLRVDGEKGTSIRRIVIER